MDVRTGNWRHRDAMSAEVSFGLAERLRKDFDEAAVQTTEKDLIPFVYM
jgi:hypothetical protein